MTRNIQTELTNWARILSSSNLCSDVSPITGEIGGVRRNNMYHIQKLKIGPFNPPRNTIPNDVNTIYVLLDIKFKPLDLAITDIDNNIEEYLFNVTFIGEGNGEQKYYSSFHLDYDKSDEAKVIHPWFHFTYGGHSLKGYNTGNVLFLSAPRLPFLPMDFFLGIDFIISNFLNKEDYYKISGNSLYKNALKNSQNSVWKQYILSIAHHWCKFSGCEYNIKNENLCKHFIPTLI